MEINSLKIWLVKARPGEPAVGRSVATRGGTIAVAVLLTASLSGCFGPTSVPVSDRSASVEGRGAPRVVRQGESLYSIAWEAGKDPEQIAKLNKLETPYRVRPGQKIVIEAPGTNNVSKRRATSSTSPLIIKPKPANRASTGAGSQVDPSSWLWPVGGNVVRGFKPSSGRKGIDIQSQEGDTVRSTAAGKVVYAGAGLRGYGRLVIVKHGARYLSAYAHNRRLTVAEGQFVRAGEKIAEVGLSTRNRPELHFEIRRDGKPVDPRQFLPSR